jgi:ketosteroid isomerase-like protein
MSTSTEVVAAFYAAIEDGRHGAELEPYLTDDACTITRPNAVLPNGGTSDRAAMLASSTSGAALLARQSYDLCSMVEHDGEVIARLRWSGTVASDAGPFAAGQTLTAHIAQFVRVRDGRIARIETYDCYQPISAD